MTKGDPLAGSRRLADMNIPPTSFVYKPPKGGDIHEYSVQLAIEHELFVRQHIYRGIVVDFAIVQHFTGTEFPVEVARVDCRHGEVHEHQFGRTRGKLTRTVLERIDDNDPWKIVNGYFYTCNDEWNDAEAWERRYRTWESS